VRALDHEEVRRALDVAPIEELLGALVRRAARLLALSEAACHEMDRPQTTERLAELAARCAASAIECRKLSDALHVLAPHSDLDCVAAGYARAAATFDRLTALRLEGARGTVRVSHA